MLNTTEEVKKRYRKIHTCPDSCKAVLYSGSLQGIGVIQQFYRDLKTYGLWEALLYAEGYEDEAYYKKGTAQAALDAAIAAEKEPNEQE